MDELGHLDDVACVHRVELGDDRFERGVGRPEAEPLPRGRLQQAGAASKTALSW